jgi:UDP-glucose 4-epimerase
MDKPALLLTGACGFIGRSISEAACKGDWSVYGVDVVPRGNAPPMKEYYQLRLPDDRFFEVVEKIKPGCCVHCAGGASVIQSIKDPIADFAAGPLLTIYLLEALRKHAPDCRTIFLSSAAVYGNPAALPVDETQAPAPISPYGFHKWQCELLCREFAESFNLSTASVRIFSAYGPGLRKQVLWEICRKVIVDGRIALHGTGAESRDFVHAGDIAQAVLSVLAKAPLEGEVYNVASGRETTIRELARLVAASLRADLEPVFDGEIPTGDPINWCADITKVRRLGFVPEIKLEEGVEDYCRWARTELGDI